MATAAHDWSPDPLGGGPNPDLWLFLPQNPQLSQHCRPLPRVTASPGRTDLPCSLCVSRRCPPCCAWSGWVRPLTCTGCYWAFTGALRGWLGAEVGSKTPTASPTVGVPVSCSKGRTDPALVGPGLAHRAQLSSAPHCSRSRAGTRHSPRGGPKNSPIEDNHILGQ